MYEHEESDYVDTMEMYGVTVETDNSPPSVAEIFAGLPPYAQTWALAQLTR